MPEIGPVEAFEPVRLKDAVILTAFPTTGSAPSIAAQYLVRHLGLPLVGHLRMPELGGFVNIQSGLVTSVVRIYGGEVACKIGRTCPSLYIITSDLGLPPKVMERVAAAIMAWASQGDAHLLLVLEAVVRAEGDDTPDVFVASPDAKLIKTLGKAGIPAMERALIAGLGAQILLDAPLRGVHAASLLVEASKDHPDGRAAVALVEAIAKLVPDVSVDAKPLLKEAMALEVEIRRTQAQAEPPSLPAAPTFI
ncbi:MAG: PAC2 family protein [Candidatus Thermoplasmatota archaeon]